MGILYTVWPIDTAAQGWLQSQAIAFPDRPARWPTRQELQSLLGTLSGFKVRYTDNGPGRRWDALITDEAPGEGECWTLLHAEPKDGDDAETHIHFEKGEPLLIASLLRELSRAVGPMMLLPDVDRTPMVVAPEYSVLQIVEHFIDFELHVEQWNKIRTGVPNADRES